MRSVMLQSCSYPWLTMTGPSSFTIRITEFMKGYSNKKVTSSSTVRSTTVAADIASCAAAL